MVLKNAEEKCWITRIKAGPCTNLKSPPCWRGLIICWNTHIEIYEMRDHGILANFLLKTSLTVLNNGRKITIHDLGIHWIKCRYLSISDIWENGYATYVFGLQVYLLKYFMQAYSIDWCTFTPVLGRLFVFKTFPLHRLLPNLIKPKADMVQPSKATGFIAHVGSQERHMARFRKKTKCPQCNAYFHYYRPWIWGGEDNTLVCNLLLFRQVGRLQSVTLLIL